MTDIDFRLMFARNLTNQLNRTGIKRADLAAMLHVSPSAVSQWCQGIYVPRVEKIDQMAKIFGCQRSDLMTDSTERKEYYLNEYAAGLAEFLHQAHEYRVLFDAARDVKPEDTEIVKTLLDRFKKGNE